MDTQFNQEQKSKITLNLDEFDIDSYDFKPVTKGLGFHDPLEKSKRTNISGAKALKKSMPRKTQSNMGVSHLQNTPTTVSDPNLMSGIDALYGNKPLMEKAEVKQQPIIVEKKAKPTQKQTEATILEMSGAFVVDLLLIALINVALFTSFYGFAFKTIAIEGLQYFILSSLPFFAALFSLIFITYFSLLEPMGTWGKKLWSLKTVMVGTNKPITIKAAFVRALVTLCSFPLLFFPLIFDFQGKLSDSSVLESK